MNRGSTPTTAGPASGVLLLLASFILFLLGAPLALGQRGGAESTSHTGTHAKASKQQLNKRTEAIQQQFGPIWQQLLGLQGQIAGLSGTGGPATPTGPAGGALAGTYPNPTLNVSGGPCANGQALTDVSALAALTCDVGVLSDGNSNVAAVPNPFPNLAGGGSNSALGSGAMSANTTGTNNTAVGRAALNSNTMANANSAFGQSALQSNITGADNTAVGAAALGANTTGSDNTAIGDTALGSNDIGVLNTAVGQLALSSNTDGLSNSALGDGALLNNVGSDNNTAVGAGALLNTTGASNTALGEGAGSGITAGNNNIMIDGHPLADESNTIRIGDSQTATFVAGIASVAVTGDPVHVTGAGQLGVTASSRRYKTEIEPLLGEGLMELRPVSFRYREGPPDLHYGLIAEEVEEVLPELVSYGEDGRPETVRYHELPALLLAKAQEQQRQIEGQRRRIEALEADNRRLDELEQEVVRLSRRLGGG